MRALNLLMGSLLLLASGALSVEEVDEEEFARDVRIVLVSAEFSKELTTTVLWLCDRELDIRCVRLRPYQDGDRLLFVPVVPAPRVVEKAAVQLTLFSILETGTESESGGSTLDRHPDGAGCSTLALAR